MEDKPSGPRESNPVGVRMPPKTWSSVFTILTAEPKIRPPPARMPDYFFGAFPECGPSIHMLKGRTYHSKSSTVTSDIIRRFNRETGWLATGVLGTVVFAALMLAVQVQERHPKAIGLPEEKGVDHPFTKISPQENSSPQMRTPAAVSTPILLVTPETDRHDLQANAGSLAHRQAPARVLEPTVSRARWRSSIRSRIVDVKRRLIALWHKSLLRE
jgi:hypothetical protein